MASRRYPLRRQPGNPVRVEIRHDWYDSDAVWRTEDGFTVYRTTHDYDGVQYWVKDRRGVFHSTDYLTEARQTIAWCRDRDM
jgi:hypothetical protein